MVFMMAGYIYSTWYDDRETDKSIPDNRAGSWKYITADFCRIASDPCVLVAIQGVKKLLEKTDDKKATA